MPNDTKTAKPTDVSTAIEQAKSLALPAVLRELGLSPEDVQVLKDTIAKGATDTELAFFLRFCKGKDLDPFARQVHLVKRWDPTEGREVMSIQTGIDGYRVIAERTELYEASEGPFWCGPEGTWVDVWLDETRPPKAAKFTVHRKGRTKPITATAHFKEYAQTKKDGGLTRMWATMPAGQIAKCAEALALRRAFPEDLGAVHTDVEMQQADNVWQAKDEQEPPRVATKAAAMRDKLVVVPTPAPAQPAQMTLAAPSIVTEKVPAAADAPQIVDAEIVEPPATEEPAPAAAPAPEIVDAPPTPTVEQKEEAAKAEAAKMVVEQHTAKMATTQQAERIRDLMDLMGIPKSAVGPVETGPRLMVLRSASKRPTISKVSELTFEQADEAIFALAQEAKKRGLSIADKPQA